VIFTLANDRQRKNVNKTTRESAATLFPCGGAELLGASRLCLTVQVQYASATLGE
jgi:hypothetical protein